MYSSFSRLAFLICLALLAGAGCARSSNSNPSVSVGDVQVETSGGGSLKITTENVTDQSGTTNGAQGPVKTIAVKSSSTINAQVDTGDKKITNEAEKKNNTTTTTDPREEEKVADQMAPPRFYGTVLAGSLSPLLDFNEEDYKTALASDKLVVLYFYAKWCPVCVAEFPKMQEAFGELQGSNVVGFRVNFNDNDTNDAERELARQFGVAYQHTKVFVKLNQRILKAPDSWDKSRYIEEIGKKLL